MRETIRYDFVSLERRIRRQAVLIARHQNQKSRTDRRDWVKTRRERTRHLIELGGLVQKAGLVDLTDDDRAVLLGAFLDLARYLRGYGDLSPADLKARWGRIGLRSFEADRKMP